MEVKGTIESKKSLKLNDEELIEVLELPPCNRQVKHLKNPQFYTHAHTFLIHIVQYVKYKHVNTFTYTYTTYHALHNVKGFRIRRKYNTFYSGNEGKVESPFVHPK